MGAGIAYVTTNKARVPVRLKEKEPRWPAAWPTLTG